METLVIGMREGLPMETLVIRLREGLPMETLVIPICGKDTPWKA